MLDGKQANKLFTKVMALNLFGLRVVLVFHSRLSVPKDIDRVVTLHLMPNNKKLVSFTVPN